MSQTVPLFASLLYPIVVVRMMGVEAYGIIALAVSYSGLPLAIVAGGIGQSIIKQGMRTGALTQLVGGALVLSAVVTIALLARTDHGALLLIEGALAVFLATIALHLVYYYSIWLGQTAVTTAVFAAESAARILLTLMLGGAGASQLHLGLACFLGSSAVAALGALAVLAWRARQTQADLRVAVGARGTFGIDRDVFKRFLVWAVSGIYLTHFDRTIFATALDPVTRASYLFVNNLYTAAFGVLTNTATLVVLRAGPSHRMSTQLSYLVWVATGLISASACTAVMFALAPVLRDIIQMDLTIAFWPILFALAYKALLYVHSVCFAYLENTGRAAVTFKGRAAGSISLVTLTVAAGMLTPPSLGALALFPMAVLAFASFGWVRGKVQLQAA